MDGFVVIGKVAKWLGILLLVGIGIAYPPLGVALAVAWLVSRSGAGKTIEDDRREAREKMRFCSDCNRNVRPVRGSPSAGGLIATGGLGYLLKNRNSCPFCRSEVMEFPRAPIANEA